MSSVAKKEFREDTEYDKVSSDEQESKNYNFCADISKNKDVADTCADKVVKDAENKNKVVANPH